MNDIEKQDRLTFFKLLGEAEKQGFAFAEPIELQDLKSKHKPLVPLLMKYLHLFQADNFKDLVIGALGVKGFYEATGVLVKEFQTTVNEYLKWRIGDTLYSIMDKRYEDQYIDIVTDKTNGTSRQMVTILLGKLKSQKAIPALLSLLDDEDINGHVVMALGYYKKAELIPYIEPFLTHPKAWIRKEAKRSIEKYEKANKKII